MTTRKGGGVLGGILLGVLTGLLLSSSQPAAQARGAAPPISVPHHVHVQTSQIDGQYCQADGRRSGFAGTDA